MEGTLIISKRRVILLGKRPMSPLCKGLIKELKKQIEKMKKASKGRRREQRGPSCHMSSIS